MRCTKTVLEHPAELTYDGFGRHTSTTFYSPTQSVVVGGRYGQLESTYKREYYGGGQIVDDGKLVMTRFGAGYFDDNDNTYYYFTDYQGNNTSLVNKSGSIVQTTDYYPYGEIYNVSSTNPGIKNNFLYGDKEYIFMDGLHEYDYGARRSIIPLNFFGSIDPHCENYYGISPYVLCAGNPIKFIDPTGEDIMVLYYDGPWSFDHLAMLIQNEDGKWNYYSVNGNNVYISGSHKGGREFNDVGVGSWDSPQEFLDSSYNERLGDESKDDKTKNHFGYSVGYKIKTTSEQDKIMRETFTYISYTNYDIIKNNCAHAVQKTMIEAGVPVSEKKYEDHKVPVSTSLGLIEINLGVRVKYDLNVDPYDAYTSIKKANPNGTPLYKHNKFLVPYKH